MAKAAPPSGRPIDVSDERWAEAVRREPTIRSLAASERNSRNAVDVAARDLRLSRSQIYRLIEAFRKKPVAQSLVLEKPGPRRGTRLLPPGVEDIIDRCIETIYKRRERPTQQKLKREIWADCIAANLKPPSRKAISARIAARPIKELVKAREGAKAAHNRLGLVRPGLRPSAPLEIVQIDHTPVDVHLVDELGRAPLGRPYLTLLLDVYSRCVLGFTVSFDAPSAAGVALAIAQGVLPKEKWLGERGLQIEWPVHGIPKRLHLDNAQEFHSRALKRGCEQYGIAIDYRPPGKARFGGHIERLMGTLMTRIHALPGSTSSNVVKRGDYPSEQKAILTLSEFELVFAREVLGIYHNEFHSDLSKTPLAAWAESIARVDNAWMPLTDPEAVVLDFLPFEERVVGREGVRLFNTTYFDDALGTLIGGPDRKRRVKYDPRDMSAVFVELQDGDHIRVPYADSSKPPISLWEHKAALRTLREQGRRTVNEEIIFNAVKANRQTIAQAQSSNRAARRAQARSPTRRAGMSIPAQFAPQRQSLDAAMDEPRGLVDERAKIPLVVEYDDWKTEFSS